jgi:hypothetical protein
MHATRRVWRPSVGRRLLSAGAGSDFNVVTYNVLAPKLAGTDFHIHCRYVAHSRAVRR